MHDDKTHGIEMDKIPLDMKLLIIPDASSNDNEQVKKLHELGIEVLIADHHESDNPPTYATIVNNQLCDYPNKTLSGAGIVWKFIKYLDEKLKLNNADYYTDLAMIGIIGDVMNLNEKETRYIIEQGMNNINNPFLKEMIKKQSYSLKDKITPNGIAFYIVPYINAVIRSGTLDEKFIVFEAMLDIMGNKKIKSGKRGASLNDTESLAEKACRVSSNAKNRQKKIQQKEVERLEEKITTENMLENKVLILALQENEKIEKNLTGLIANVISHEYMRPTLILNYKNGYYSGSGRGVSNIGFDNFKDFLNESNLVEYAEGHQGACGVSVSEVNLNKLLNYCNESLKDKDFDSVYNVDFEFTQNTLIDDYIFEINNYEKYWGNGITEPYIAIKNIKVNKNNVTLMSPDRNPTLKILLNDNIEILKFKSSKEEYEKLNTSIINIIDIVGRCSVNEWNGKKTPQIIVEDYDIIGKEYDF